jgi:hypothetical protein
MFVALFSIYIRPSSLNRDIRTDPTHPGIRTGKGEQRDTKI